MEENGNENTTVQNLWDAAKAFPRGKLTIIQAHLNNREKSQTKKINLILKGAKKVKIRENP